MHNNRRGTSSVRRGWPAAWYDADRGSSGISEIPCAPRRRRRVARDRSTPPPPPRRPTTPRRRGGSWSCPTAPRGRPPSPDRVPLLPLRSDVVFPQTVVPLVVNRSSGIRLIDEVLVGDKMIGLVTQRHPDIEEPGLDDLYPTVCVGSVLKMLKFPDGSTRIVCQGLFRARLRRGRQARALPDRPDRAARRTSSRKGSSSTRWCTTSTACSSGWSTRASRCPRSCRSPR